tara:strand:- start:29 stop:211 length:183 start_codon:yes stop_codon:yes gene_type:complete
MIFINPIFSQLQVGDTSPDFVADVCFNGEDVNPDLVNGDDWSLYDEGAGKVTWINLFTSW